jgi:glycosyltransferase involved in cell wall biosynthesis
MGLGDVVVFGGEAIDTSEALRQADVFALTSLSDGLPYALLEAMVAEIPIVATDAGGAREAVGEGGLIVPPGDQVGLVEALATLLQMRDTARRCGEHARERAMKKFTEERWVKAYRASYDRLTARDVKPTVKPAPAELTLHPSRPAAIAS